MDSTTDATGHASRLLLFAAIVAFGAFGIAMWNQLVHGMQPCPWCVLQRLLILTAGVLALPGALIPMLLARLVLAALADLAAMAGVAAALWQQLVASQSSSCAMTLADRIVMATGLDQRFPTVFMATASCDEASSPLFGVPYPLWSGAAFLMISVFSAIALVLTLRRR